jgi:hypothetical protein
MQKRREARLRPEYSSLYPGVPTGEWKSSGELLDCVIAARLQAGRRSGELLHGRLLDDRHFEFRGGAGQPHFSLTRITDFQPPAP